MNLHVCRCKSNLLCESCKHGVLSLGILYFLTDYISHQDPILVTRFSSEVCILNHVSIDLIGFQLYLGNQIFKYVLKICEGINTVLLIHKAMLCVRKLGVY